MSEDGQKSKTVSFRVDPNLDETVQQILEGEEINTSQFLRSVWRATRNNPSATLESIDMLKEEQNTNCSLERHLKDHMLAEREIIQYSRERDAVGAHEVLKAYEERYDTGADQLKKITDLMF